MPNQRQTAGGEAARRWAWTRLAECRTRSSHADAAQGRIEPDWQGRGSSRDGQRTQTARPEHTRASRLDLAGREADKRLTGCLGREWLPHPLQELFMRHAEACRVTCRACSLPPLVSFRVQTHGLAGSRGCGGRDVSSSIDLSSRSNRLEPRPRQGSHSSGPAGSRRPVAHLDCVGHPQALGAIRSRGVRCGARVAGWRGGPRARVP